MTLLTRAALFAAFSFGIAGLAAVSTPGVAAETASATLVDSPAGAALIRPAVAIAVRTAMQIPPVTAVAEGDVVQDDPQTALDAADAGTFQSLAAAVDGQVVTDAPSDELRCLAGAIYYESKGEPLAGQLAVAEVIINRTRSGRFPRSLCGVVTQAGQFSFVRGGAIPAVNPALDQWKVAVAVAQVALGDAWASPAAQALFFHARRAAPGWSKARVASIGNHVFYR